MKIQIVVCAPVAPVAGETFDPTEDPKCCYAAVPCPECKQMMWLGSRSWIEVQNRRARMMCMICAVERFGPNPRMELLTDRDPKK